MSDFLVELGANKTARNMIKTLGLPLPLPQKLRRATGPLEERPLHDRPALVQHLSAGELKQSVALALARMGANSWVVDDGDSDLALYAEQGEAFGRVPRALAPGEKLDGPRAACLIFDGTGAAGPQELAEAHRFFQTHIRGLGRCGRVLVLARPPAQCATPAAAAAARGLEGFVRTVAKESGRKGSTAQIVFVAPGAEARLEPALRFLLSPRSAFVTGQPVHLSAAVKTDGEFPATRPLDARVALVTGAAQGIGAAIARALAREGAQVVVMDRPAEAERAAAVAQEVGGTPLLCDLTDEDAPADTRALLKDRYDGRLDIVVHNAGVTRDKMLANMDSDRWDMTMDVNLISLIRLNEALLPLMPDDGRVVCLSSIAGLAGNAGQSNYAASKAGLVGYVQARAAELCGRGIAVNAVAPGFIETRMTARIPLAIREVARRFSSLSQGGQPGDVAEAVLFLASPGAAGMSGQVLRVCGQNLIGA